MMKYIFLLLMVAVMPAVMAERTFVHPGCLHKKSDLDRMKYMVETKAEPYWSTFKQLKEFPKARFDYEVRGDLSMTDTGPNKGAFISDTTAAYLNALMWYITGDERHAEKCVEIFNAWQNLTRTSGFALNSGNRPWKMIEGAEIIRSTYDGWAADDIEKFKAMLVSPGYSTRKIPEGDKSFYWNILNGDPDRHGNQDAIAFRAMISMAVFLDNEIMFDRALNYYKGLPHRPDDLSYTSGPGVSTTEASDTPYHTVYKHKRETRKEDYGYNGTLANYFWENGQCQESSRDQQHSYFGLSIFQMLAEVAWNQGDPAWNYLDNRLLKAFEYSARYNTSFIKSYSDQPKPWEPTVESGEFIQRKDRTGRWFSKAICPYFEGDHERLSRGKFVEHRPIYEQGWAHFNVRMGQGDQAVWTKRSLDLVELEGNGWNTDHPGWGGLTFHRPPGCAGDPISGFENGVPVFDMHVLPTTIEAENYDYFPDIGNGRTYFDTTKGNRNKAYRNDDVDVVKLPDGGHALSQLANGEWLTYTVYVPRSGNYDLGVRYLAREEGQIRFDFQEKPVTKAATLPMAEQWETYTVADGIPLEQGVQQMKVTVLGKDVAYILDRITIRETESGDSDPLVEIPVESNVAGTADRVQQIEKPVPDEKPAEDMTDTTLAEETGNPRSYYIIIGGLAFLGLLVVLLKNRRR
ncbi:alginate lyase family protein [Pontiellaceae bacterium B12227]|nr:alginate lyase family protein [Pontiellaceae bacterium B12227]